MFKARRTFWLVAGLLSLSLSACSDDSGGEGPKAACDPVCDANACQVCDTSGDTPLCVSICGEDLICQDGECVIPEDAQCDACDPCQYCDTSLDPAACVDSCGEGTTCNETTNACEPEEVTPACDPPCEDGEYCNEDGAEPLCMIERTIDHRNFITETSLDDGPAATDTCRGCHDNVGGEFDQMLGSAHWRWDDAPTPGTVIPDGGGPPLEITETGKNPLINNFCIAVEKNEARCAQCHAGYKFTDIDTYDWNDKANMDCLVCHADPASGYAKKKAPGGAVADGVDLVLAAKSVGTPTRANCGACHFTSGGGDNVKKGDLGSALRNPTEDVDVHMGNGVLCADCHTTSDHLIAGKGVHNPVAEGDGRVMCSDCHMGTVHVDAVLNAHTANLACQTCHVPAFSRTQATKVDWKWETAGQFDTDPIPMQTVELADGSTVMKPEYDWMKGDFVWDANVRPTYAWYDGGVERLTVLSEGFISGDGSSELDPISIAKPIGDRGVGGAKLYPFKVMTGTQAADLNATDGEFLIVPWLFSGDPASDAFWKAIPRLFASVENPTQAEIDEVWDTALTEGALDADQITPPTTYKRTDPTGNQVPWDWVYTEMYLQINHEVAPKTRALSCNDCHGSNWDDNFGALTDAGYICDPLTGGGADACAPPAP